MRTPADLLIAAQTGDPDALERLLAVAQPDVRRFARRQCHCGSVIEDVVQETLMVIWRRVGSVRDPAAFAGPRPPVAASSGRCRPQPRLRQ